MKLLTAKKIIRKNIICFVLASLLILSMTGCQGKTNSGSTLDKDTWIVGLDDSFAPMGFRDENGELTGFDVDMAKAFGDKFGKTIELQPIDWSMKESELNAGNIDFIWNGYTITDGRKEKVDFSAPYLNNKQIIVTLDSSDIYAKADLAGKKVGAQNESSAVTAMEKESDLYSSFDGGEAITFEDNNQALMDLEAGRIDAVVADEVLLRYYIALKGEENYRILDEDFGSEEYGVGIRKGDQKMVEAFNKAYNELKEDGTLKAISEKWFGEDIIR
jgi:polar amino acid transport system substrate-binding protein